MDKHFWLLVGLGRQICTGWGKQLWQQRCGTRSLCWGVYDGALCLAVHRRDKEYTGNECTFLQLKLSIYVFYIFWTESPILVAALCFKRGIWLVSLPIAYLCVKMPELALHFFRYHVFFKNNASRSNGWVTLSRKALQQVCGLKL